MKTTSTCGRITTLAPAHKKHSGAAHRFVSSTMNVNGSLGLIGSRIWHNSGVDVLDPLLLSQQNTIGQQIGRWNRMARLGAWILWLFWTRPPIWITTFAPVLHDCLLSCPCGRPKLLGGPLRSALGDRTENSVCRQWFPAYITQLFSFSFYFCGDAYNVMHLYS